ncbi:uncharacterized protein KZ484_021493 isoform 2-T2 [Pholidichthys leucotaenia]
MENRDKWTDSEVQAFLTLFAAADTVQRGFDSSRRNKKVFAEISSELSSMGIYHTAKQCRDKLKKLKQDYKRIKDYNNQSGPYSRTGKWYQALDAVLGQRPEYGGTLGLEEPAEACLEATCEPRPQRFQFWQKQASALMSQAVKVPVHLTAVHPARHLLLHLKDQEKESEWTVFCLCSGRFGSRMRRDVAKVRLTSRLFSTCSKSGKRVKPLSRKDWNGWRQRPWRRGDSRPFSRAAFWEC